MCVRVYMYVYMYTYIYIYMYKRLLKNPGKSTSDLVKFALHSLPETSQEQISALFPMFFLFFCFLCFPSKISNKNTPRKGAYIGLCRAFQRAM